MLKSTLFSLVLVSVALGTPLKKEAVELPAPIADAIMQATQSCSLSGNDLSELFTLLRDGKWKEDPEFKKLIGCSFIASGFATSDGNVVVDRALILFEGKEEAKRVIIECANGEDDPIPEIKLFNFYKCFQMKSPYTLNLHY